MAAPGVVDSGKRVEDAAGEGSCRNPAGGDDTDHTDDADRGIGEAGSARNLSARELHRKFYARHGHE